MTDFLFTTYSGVTAWQLLTPWVALVLFAGLGIWGWVMAIEQKNRADLWEDCENITRIRLTDRLENALEEKRVANDKAISLQAQIAKLISRPRAKNGRFEKKDKG